MNNKLQEIVATKKREVAALKEQLQANTQHPIARILKGETHGPSVPSFKKALKSAKLSVIAEIKRKSPSKGLIAPIADPIRLAHNYISGGANALSILTDTNYFGGSIDDLSSVAKAIQANPVPIIRKDFVIDNVQIAEAAVAGASAVLLIVAVLGEQTKALLDFARSINIDALVEVHDQDELNIALKCGADIIGINNRNLNTFDVDTNRAHDLVTAIPSNIIKVAESGITEPAIARQYRQVGFDAVLIGETLVKSADPNTFIQACRDDTR